MPIPRSRFRAALAVGAVGAAALLPTVDAAITPAPVVEQAFAPALVTVTADRAERNLIASSGLDVTEHAGHHYVEVVVHTPADLALLESFGLPVEVRIPDLLARGAEIAALDRAYAADVDTSPLPSGRTAYRLLEDYEADLRALADDHAGLVNLLELPHETVQGRPVLGIEIAADVDAEDGRPTFVIMGLHHAREWPSGEMTMEFAIDLVDRFTAGDERVRAALESTRVVVIPVVNPDGFHASISDGMVVDLREAGRNEDLNAAVGDPDGELTGLVPILATPGDAYKRKNCSTSGAPDGAEAACGNLSSPGGYGLGVDLNRNYGTFHAGPGTDPENPASPVYPGPAGFSEPETRNIQDLVASRHVTMLITNHTFGNLLLRPNGVHPETIGPDGLPFGNSPDEDAMAALGERMVANNGYANQHGWELYDTTGTTEDYSYNATGGYGYTFEVGPHEFHPPFAEVVDEYVGAGEFAGKGNREAYLIALEAAADPAHHAIVEGTVPAGARLELRRTGAMPTWTGATEDTVAVDLVSVDGSVEWHINPSTRPIVEAKSFQVLSDEATETASFTEPTPALGESVDIRWRASAEGARGIVDLTWATPDDLDLEVYRFTADGKLVEVGTSGNFEGSAEQVVFDEVHRGWTYVARIVNYASVADEFTVDFTTFGADTVTTTPLIEAWTLSCFVGDELLEQKPLVIDRGQRAKLPFEVCVGDD